MKPKNLTEFDLLTLNCYHERELRRRQPGVSDTGLWRYVLAWLPALNKNAIKSFEQHICKVGRPTTLFSHDQYANSIISYYRYQVTMY